MKTADQGIQSSGKTEVSGDPVCYETYPYTVVLSSLSLELNILKGKFFLDLWSDFATQVSGDAYEAIYLYSTQVVMIYWWKIG